jgi:predicted enzyme related to lactoylglutathione lyase
VFFTCDGIEQTHRELSEGGVTFPTPPTRMDFGWWAMVEDDDGTRLEASVSAAPNRALPPDEKG